MTKKNRRSQSTTDGDVLDIVTDSCIMHGFRQEYEAVITFLWQNLFLSHCVYNIVNILYNIYYIGGSYLIHLGGLNLEKAGLYLIQGGLYLENRVVYI